MSSHYQSKKKKKDNKSQISLFFFGGKKKEKTSSKVFQAGHSRRIKEGKGFPLMDFNDCILYDINLESP